jgi:hypothetical protein
LTVGEVQFGNRRRHDNQMDGIFYRAVASVKSPGK